MRVFSNTNNVTAATALQLSVVAAIFDFDGTLFNTEQMGSECVFQAVTKQAPQKTLSAAEKKALEQRCMGRSITDILDEVAKAMQLDRQILSDDYRKFWRKGLHKGMTINDSIALVRQLHEHGIPVSISTGSELDQVKPLLKMQGIAPLFHHIIAADDYGHGEGKPNPTPYLLSIKKHNVPPQYIVVFEDSVAGVEAAKAAKVGKIIALCHRPSYEKYLLHAGADLVVTSLQDPRVFALCNISLSQTQDEHINSTDAKPHSRL